MKGPGDNKTVDGLSDLVKWLDSAPLLRKTGRKPRGEQALTPAEKQRAYRLCEKQKSWMLKSASSKVARASL